LLVCWKSVEFLKISGLQKKEVPARTKKMEAGSLGWTPYLRNLKKTFKVLSKSKKTFKLHAALVHAHCCPHADPHQFTSIVSSELVSISYW